MPNRTIRTTYPCCNGLAKLVALTLLPRQTYNRVCPECATTYLVERTTHQVSFGTIDQLDWTDKASRIYTRKYGSNS